MVEQTFDIKTLHVTANVRYWQDGEIDGVEDTEGTLTPCRVGNNWCPVIDLEKGIITNWKEGVTAKIHYKVVDEGTYSYRDESGKEAFGRDGDYVPKFLCPKRDGYGDYIIMDIDGTGKIDGWKFTADDFPEEED